MIFKIYIKYKYFLAILFFLLLTIKTIFFFNLLKMLVKFKFIHLFKRNLRVYHFLSVYGIKDIFTNK
jgi:hypothetical protein